MILRRELVQFLDDLLCSEGGPIEDPSNNGLQVEGTAEVKRVVFAVDACRALFDAAEEKDADFLFVHHGLSWGGGIRRATGVVGGRLRQLFANGMSLYASHLPLDRHPEVGHNALLARKLGLETLAAFFVYHGSTIGWAGSLSRPVAVAGIAERLQTLLNGEVQIVGEADKEIRTLGIVSGGGADAVESCRDAGVDGLVTGEFAHQHYHPALEAGIPVVVGGHYATETPGIHEVMARVSDAFDVACSFVDLPTGL